MSDALYTATGDQPLCPGLYQTLQRRFRSVLIASPGQGFLAQSRTDPSTGRGYTAVAAAGEYYRVCCPWCRDTRHRLWINHMYGQRDATGRRMLWLAVCYNEDCTRDWGHSQQLEEICLSLPHGGARDRAVFAVRPGEVEPSTLQPAVLPGTVMPVSQLWAGHPAWDYMVVQRRYTREVLDTYEVGYCVEPLPQYPAAAGKLVFPVRFGGELVGWQCRFVGDGWRAAGSPKYYTRPGMHKSLLLYNYDRASRMPFVVVMEGVTDVHTLGDYGVSLLGSTLSRRQRELLITTWAGKPILLMLDGDAREEMRGEITDLRNNAQSQIGEIVLPAEFDPGDYTQGELRQIIHQQAAHQRIALPC